MMMMMMMMMLYLVRGSNSRMEIVHDTIPRSSNHQRGRSKPIKSSTTDDWQTDGNVLTTKCHKLRRARLKCRGHEIHL